VWVWGVRIVDDRGRHQVTDESEIPELTATEKARWDAIRSTIDAMAKGVVEGTLDAEGLEATTAKLQQVDVDLKRIIDSLHIPEDAGVYRDALVAMLRRIPDNWGRWISCNAGWYPLITRLDADLCALDPDYRIHQIKEKYGTLRYYAESRIEDAAARARFLGLISEAERQSAAICERCGEPGELCAMGGQSPWYKTLCPPCVEAISAESGRRYRQVLTENDDE
jgi:hypothetical protein